MNAPQLDTLCINTLRFLAADAVQQAASGHPGMPMGMAAPAYVLWTEFLRHNPADPEWPDRDRFVLSAGHGSMLLYALLHLTGYDLPLDALKNFRQWRSRTPGHPEYGETPGVEITTGPLGQGIASAVGMAVAEAHLAARFNRPGRLLVNHRTWVIAGDGDLMEGISGEAASLAGHLRLGKLIVLYDDNRISIDGPTSLAFTENVEARHLAYGWHVLRVDDANDLPALRSALRDAEAETERPTLVRIRSRIGFGAPNREGTAKAHGEPLGVEELRGAKRNLGWPEEPPFRIPEEVGIRMRKVRERGEREQAAWRAALGNYTTDHPRESAEFIRRMRGELPEGWSGRIPSFSPAEKPIATRKINPAVLDALHETMPELMGGSADLTPSCFTAFSRDRAFSASDRLGRNLHFGVREHAMGALLNGLSLHGGFRPFGSTFLVFSDYLRPAVRMAALMRRPVIFVFTHDSIGVGEDGPTHQPVEHIAALRVIPNLVVLRPADINEAAEAWRFALKRTDGPCALIQTRQNLPVLDPEPLRRAGGMERGGYVLAEAEGGNPEAILIATGSEVALALDAQKALEAGGRPTRVVSLPSMELFDRQDAAYRNAVLPPAAARRIAIEAASPFGWDRYLGPSGLMIGMDRFGASAPAPHLFREFGFTVEAIVAAARRLG